MASIQVLELRPVEDQIEDLSYDMTGSIRGGGVSEFFAVMAVCLDVFEGILEVGEVVDATAFFTACLVDVGLEALFS